MDDLKRKKVTIKSDWGEPTKDHPMVKSVFSLEHKSSGWMNSRTYLGWMGLGPYYREFKVGLLVECH